MPTFTVKEKVKNQVVDAAQEQDSAEAILLQAVIKYKELQAQITFIQNELKAPRAIIESAASAAPEQSIVTPLFKISLIEVERENFDKKAAIAAIGRKKLAPYMSTTTFQQLRVS